MYFKRNLTSFSLLLDIHANWNFNGSPLISTQSDWSRNCICCIETLFLALGGRGIDVKSITVEVALSFRFKYNEIAASTFRSKTIFPFSSTTHRLQSCRIVFMRLYGLLYRSAPFYDWSSLLSACFTASSFCSP